MLQVLTNVLSIRLAASINQSLEPLTNNTGKDARDRSSKPSVGGLIFPRSSLAELVGQTSRVTWSSVIVKREMLRSYHTMQLRDESNRDDVQAVDV
jgi:hypothetical protein